MGTKPKFGAKKDKKNVFNPFAKKTGNTSMSKPSDNSSMNKPADPISTGFGNFEGGNGMNKLGTGGFSS